MDARTPHPSLEILEAFALGRLDFAAIEEIEAHVAGCAMCTRKVQDVPNDSLIELLRRIPLRAARL